MSSSVPFPPPLALTMGDPAGIGIEIAAKAWRARHEQRLAPFVLYADPAAVEDLAAAAGVAVPVEPIDGPTEAQRVFPSRLPVYPIALRVPPRPGAPDFANAPAVIAAIERAVADVASGAAAALVTNPIAKSVLKSAGFAHPGHTEFLAELARRHWPGEPVHAVMMLAGADLRVVPATVHIPLADVPAALSKELLIEVIATTWRALVDDFRIAAPRIVVTGLNPHAGESGTMGREEQTIIAPALAELARRGISVSGPHPADTLFHTERRASYDAAVCMYHDQALIPLKTLAFDKGVNVTLGLPLVRTSPDHGTAFDIAGKGVASAESLVAALRLAREIADHRRGRP
ncbi:MAG: 4-hydroxythreonine-4-phosphate dehydrogenase PdxA [Pseudomonadota bacterium]